MKARACITNPNWGDLQGATAGLGGQIMGKLKVGSDLRLRDIRGHGFRILSCYGIVSSFGLGLLSFLPWALGIGAVTVLLPKRLKFSVKLVAEGIFLVKGSWWPLVLMMGIFFIKYITGYALARNLAIAFQPWFIAIVSLSLGIFSGVFLARVIAALRTRPEDGSYI